MNRLTQAPRVKAPSLAALLAAVALCAFHPAAAQAQWATSGNNISNTNTGAVGVGTSTPGNYRLHVFGVGSSVDAMFANFFGTSATQIESQAGYKVGLLNNYYSMSGATEYQRGVVTMGYSNGYASVLTGFYSRQQVHHNDATAYGVYAVAEAAASGSAGQQLFGGRFEAKTTDVSGGVGNVAYGVLAKGAVGASSNAYHSAFGVLAQATAAAGTDATVNTYAVYAEGTNSGAGGAYGIYSAAGRNYFNGNVGVGTAGPAYKLDVQGGQINASGGLCINNDCRTTWPQASTGGTSGWTDGGLSVSLTNGSANVGIGATSPNYRLVVGPAMQSGMSYAAMTVSKGSGQSASVAVGGGGSSLMEVGWDQGNARAFLNAPGATPIAFTQDGANVRLYVGPGGNVGVGTASPAQALHVNTAASAKGLLFSNSAPAAGTYTPIQFQFDVGPTAEIRAIKSNAGAGYGPQLNTDLSFRVWDNAIPGNWTDAVYVKSSGNVGIGTATPGAGYRLDVSGAAHVSGDMTVDGNIAAKYQDVAEWVPSAQKLSAGTVVVLDAGRVNHVVASSAAYDTKVAGVVSEQPGVILGTGGEGKVKVATTGRVRVKVDASRGAVHVGDLLVTSGVEGVAMKSVPVDLGGTPIHRPGTIIGKALEPLEKGTGEILVLLSLQ